MLSLYFCPPSLRPNCTAAGPPMCPSLTFNVSPLIPNGSKLWVIFEASRAKHERQHQPFGRIFGGPHEGHLGVNWIGHVRWSPRWLSGGPPHSFKVDSPSGRQAKLKVWTPKSSMATASSVAAQSCKNCTVLRLYRNHWDSLELQVTGLDQFSFVTYLTVWTTWNTRIQHVQNFSWKECFLEKRASFRGGVEHVELWGGLLNQNVLKLQKCWIDVEYVESWVELEEKGGVSRLSPKYSTYSTYSSFCLKETFRFNRLPENSTFNISPETCMFWRRSPIFP